MLKRFYDKKYMSIAIHATIFIAACILTAAFVVNFFEIREAVRGFFRILRPIVVGLILSYFCNPLMALGERYVFGWLDRFPRFPKICKRIFSLLLSYLLILVVFAGILALVIPEIVENYESLIANLTDFILKAVEWVDGLLGRVNVAPVTDLIIENSDALLASAATFLTSSVAALSSFLVVLVLSVTLSFFMLLYKESWTAGLKRIAVAILPRKLYAEVNDTLRFANRTFGRYLIGSVFDSILVGCELFLLMLIFRVPYRGLVSVVCGVTNIIPYFGPFIGAIPSFIIILTQDTFKAFLFLGLVLVVQQIDGNFINPRIIGKTTNINSMWVILAITVIGGWLGIVGMLIAIPLFSVVYMLLRRYVHARLIKRGLPLDDESYAATFSVSSYRRAEKPPRPPRTPKDNSDTNDKEDAGE